MEHIHHSSPSFFRHPHPIAAHPHPATVISSQPSIEFGAIVTQFLSSIPTTAKWISIGHFYCCLRPSTLPLGLLQSDARRRIHRRWRLPPKWGLQVRCWVRSKKPRRRRWKRQQATSPRSLRLRPRFTLAIYLLVSFVLCSIFCCEILLTNTFLPMEN